MRLDFVLESIFLQVNYRIYRYCASNLLLIGKTCNKRSIRKNASVKATNMFDCRKDLAADLIFKV